MYIINQIKYTLIFLLISLLALNGCQTEQYNEFDRVGEIIELEDGKLLVPITLELPVYSVIESKATTNETIVKNIRVLVYDSEGKVIQSVEGKIGSTNNSMEAILQRYSNPCSIQVFANIPNRLLPTFNIGSTSELINKLLLNTSDLAGASTEGIPVLSQATSFKVLDPVNINGYTASLKYACARIDITCNTPGLTLAEVTLINAAKQSKLGENINSLDLGGEEQHSTLSVSNNNIQKIYLFENSEVKAGTNEKNTTDLIVKINDGFYKICINYKNTDQTNNYSINRGYKYNVIINSVKGPGYTTFKEAIANKPANIDYNITIDDGRSKDIVTSNGSYYLGVTNSEFYLFADEAYGVTVTHLSHNAPATVTNATLSVSGTGITLRASEGYTVNTPTTATLNLKNGAVQNLPVKLDLTSVSTGGILTIRIGDLVKEIKITKKLNDTNSDRYTISSSNYTGSDFKNFTSLSDRLKISGKDLIMDNRPIYPDRNRVFAYATAFAGETRKNVLIAVKRPAQEVVYYEKYQDNTYGFSYQDGSCSSLDSLKNITEAGYGVVNINPLTSSVVTMGGNNSFTVNNTPLPNPIWEDYATGAFYPVNQQNIKITKGISNAFPVGINGKATSQYVFPLFAKGVYQASTFADGVEGKSFKIRTPLHFRNIINVDSSAWKHYLQEHDIDFSKTSIGGIDSLTAPVFEYESGFIGCLDGGMKKITGLYLTGANDGKYSSLFEYNYGTIKNIHIINGQIKGYQHAGFITGVNNKTVENCIIENSCISNEYSMAGFIAGSNDGTINNCMVIANSQAKKIITGTDWSNNFGGIAGQNTGTISNVAVIDINPLSFSANPIITSGAPDGFIGGIVGSNEGTLTDAVYIASPPTGENRYRYYPITGNQTKDHENSWQKCYFIEPIDNLGDLVGGGIAKPISGFGIGDLDPNHWVYDKINGYPFPRLKKLPKETVPTSWPGKR